MNDDVAETKQAMAEILHARDFLRETRFLDLIELDEEIRKLKEMVHFMRYRPWEWFKRDENFQRALMNEINKRIAREVEQGLMFVLYNERPDKVVQMVKRVVEDYLKKWEVDDQIAEQIVSNVVMKPEFIEKLLRAITPSIVRAVTNKLTKQRQSALEVLTILEEEYDVLEKESGD